MSKSHQRNTIRRTRVEDYLYAIEELTKGEGLATTGEVAKVLGVANGTASSFLKLLAQDGLVDRHSYSGVALTDVGVTRLNQMRLRLELLEKFLLSAFKISKSQAKLEAWYWEMVVSEELIAIIETAS